MRSDTDRIDINDNMDTIAALWPGARLADAELAEFRKQLGPLKQHIVDEAIRLTYGSCDKRRPILGLIKQQYGRLVESRTFTTEPRYTGTMTWHVSYQRTSKHGVPGAWYGQRCQTREEAERVAAQHGGRVTCMDSKSDPMPTNAELDAEARQAREVIAALPRPDVQALVDGLRSSGWIKSQLPARLSDWPRMAVLTVHAAYTLQHAKERR